MLVTVTSARVIEPAAQPLRLFRNGTPPRLRRAARAAPGPLVRRPRLLDLLPAEDGPPVVVVAAPAGYGKTTLLREWSEHDRRPFVWVTPDATGDEGIWLLAAVAAAVDAAVGDDGAAPFVLVLDDAHRLRSAPAAKALAAIARDLPAQATLALATRHRPTLPVARMRAQRLIVELGPRELAFTRPEASAMLRATGHRLDREHLDTVMQRTEGWPVAVSLAALFLGEPGGQTGLARFAGADRLVAEYVRDELLSDLPAELRTFLRRTSVVDVLSAPLCDALLERSGSAAQLAELAQAGLLVPVDRREERFRCHRLVAEVLRAELRRTTPEALPRLHRCASAWQREAGDFDGAVGHALAAGDIGAAAELVWSQVPVALAAGRTSDLERRLSRFEPARVAREPVLALTAAGCALARGQGDLAEHWRCVAASAPSSEGHAPIVAGLRAALAPDGAARMRADAARAAGSALGHPAWKAFCCLLAGTADHLLGDNDAAAQRLAEGARRAAVAAPALQALCLARLALLALEASDAEEAAALITRARAQVDRYALGAYPAMAFVLAVAALVRAQRGRVEEARADLRDAERLRRSLTDFAPAHQAEVRVLLARAALRLGDVGVARTHLTDAARRLHRLPDAVSLHARLGEAQAQLLAFTAADSGAPPTSMTAAELRILRFLPTHLSFREIAERTYVSANTVKSQANAVYRKLDVSSRSEAVTQARRCGLLDD